MIIADGMAPIKGPKKRDDIRYPDDGADQYCIRQIKNAHEDKTEHADNGRIDQLAVDKTSKSFIGKVCKFKNGIGPFLIHRS